MAKNKIKTTEKKEIIKGKTRKKYMRDYMRDYIKRPEVIKRKQRRKEKQEENNKKLELKEEHRSSVEKHRKTRIAEKLEKELDHSVEEDEPPKIMDITRLDSKNRIVIGRNTCNLLGAVAGQEIVILSHKGIVRLIKLSDIKIVLDGKTIKEHIEDGR